MGNPRIAEGDSLHSKIFIDLFIVTLGSRPGECPMLNPIPGCAAVNGCVSDGICNLGERCCLQSNCTKKCVKAVVPPPPPRPKPKPGE